MPFIAVSLIVVHHFDSMNFKFTCLFLFLKGGCGYVNYKQLNSSAADMDRVLALSREDYPKAKAVTLGCRVKVVNTRPMPHNVGLTYPNKDGAIKFMGKVDFEHDGKVHFGVTAFDPVFQVMLGITATEYGKLSTEKQELYYSKSNIERQRWMIHIGLNEFHGNISFVMKECDIDFVDDGL